MEKEKMSPAVLTCFILGIVGGIVLRRALGFQGILAGGIFGALGAVVGVAVGKTIEHLIKSD